MGQNKTLRKWILEMMIQLIQCLFVTSNLINYRISTKNKEQKRLKKFLVQVMMNLGLHIDLKQSDCPIKLYIKSKILVIQMSVWIWKKFNPQHNSWQIRVVSNQLKVFLQMMIKTLYKLKVR
jgi:hypothetical protein